jgi:hypothetical protein
VKATEAEKVQRASEKEADKSRRTPVSVARREAEFYTKPENWHPAASLFPLMDRAELETLAADIKVNGLLQHIVLHDCKLLDGRNRLLACNLAGVVPDFIDLGDYSKVNCDPVAWVFSVNAQRRNLTPSQRALIAVEAEDMMQRFAAEAKERQRMGSEIIPYPEEKGKTTEKAAKLFGVNEKYIRDAKRIKAEAPALLPQVKSGTLSVPSALRQLEWMKSGEKEPEKLINIATACHMFFKLVPFDISQEAYKSAVTKLGADSEEAKSLGCFWTRIKEEAAPTKKEPVQQVAHDGHAVQSPKRLAYIKMRKEAAPLTHEPVQRVDVRLGDLVENPYYKDITRLDGDIFIENEQMHVDMIKESIQLSSFFHTFGARQRSDGKYEIAFGHRRLQAALQLFGPDYITSVQVAKLTDQQMAFEYAINHGVDMWGDKSEAFVRLFRDNLRSGTFECKLTRSHKHGSAACITHNMKWPKEKVEILLSDVELEDLDLYDGEDEEEEVA